MSNQENYIGTVILEAIRITRHFLVTNTPCTSYKEDFPSPHSLEWTYHIPWTTQLCQLQDKHKLSWESNMDRTGKAFPRLEWNPNINVLCLRVNPNVRFRGLRPATGTHPDEDIFGTHKNVSYFHTSSFGSSSCSPWTDIRRYPQQSVRHETTIHCCAV